MEDFKKELSKSYENEQEKRRLTNQKIVDFYQNHEKMTEEEKQEFLEIEEQNISGDMYYILYELAKHYISTGEQMDLKTYMKKFIKEKEVELKQVPKQWQEGPKKEGEKGRGREI